jgi:hypothetical protein
MKLRIESNTTGDVMFGSIHLKPPHLEGYTGIALCIDRQERSNWCWAAIGAALSKYYHQTNFTQESIAAMQLHGLNDNIEQHTTDLNCDQRLDEVLSKLHCFSHWSLGKPSFDRIQYEINCGKPVCVRIQWFKGGSHYVTIKGYNAVKGLVVIEDTLIGETEYLFDDFPSKYGGGAVWIETYWTEKQPSGNNTTIHHYQPS